MELVKYCSESNVYIPNKGAIVKRVRNQVIRDEFDGSDFREFFSKFWISYIQVRNIIR